ncbi:MAG: hypothetical protein AB1779_09225 [Candidatus Thermoplasmatota archaeon]
MELNVEAKIKSYWQNKLWLMDYKTEKLFKEIRKREFINPTTKTPVTAVEVASWLDPTPLLDVVKESYPYFDYIVERLFPRLRFVAYMVLSGKWEVTKAYNALNDEEFKRLGFLERPLYELLREFVYERIGETKFKPLFDAIVKEVIRILEAKGIPIGKRCGEDATDIRALKHDKEAEYSGYYKEYGYKEDIVADLDQNLPLHYTPLGINEDEGKCCIQSQEHLISIGAKPVEWVVDDKYATYENIAASKQNGIDIVCEVQKDWIHNKKGEETEIKRVYQKYHNDEDFVPGAKLPFILQYLCKKGEKKIVGAYYRNNIMQSATKSPDEWKKKCNERNAKMEGLIGTLKTQTNLDGHKKRRGWKEFVKRVAFAMLSIVFAALIRVQNGVYQNIGSIAYIT